MKLSEYTRRMNLGRKDYSVYDLDGRCLLGWRNGDEAVAGLADRDVAKVEFFPGDPIVTDCTGEHYITVI